MAWRDRVWVDKEQNVVARAHLTGIYNRMGLVGRGAISRLYNSLCSSCHGNSTWAAWRIMLESTVPSP